MLLITILLLTNVAEWKEVLAGSPFTTSADKLTNSQFGLGPKPAPGTHPTSKGLLNVGPNLGASALPLSAQIDDDWVQDDWRPTWSAFMSYRDPSNPGKPGQDSQNLWKTNPSDKHPVSQSITRASSSSSSDDWLNRTRESHSPTSNSPIDTLFGVRLSNIDTSKSTLNVHANSNMQYKQPLKAPNAQQIHSVSLESPFHSVQHNEVDLSGPTAPDTRSVLRYQSHLNNLNITQSCATSGSTSGTSNTFLPNRVPDMSNSAINQLPPPIYTNGPTRDLLPDVRQAALERALRSLQLSLDAPPAYSEVAPPPYTDPISVSQIQPLTVPTTDKGANVHQFQQWCWQALADLPVSCDCMFVIVINC